MGIEANDKNFRETFLLSNTQKKKVIVDILMQQKGSLQIKIIEGGKEEILTKNAQDENALQLQNKALRLKLPIIIESMLADNNKRELSTMERVDIIRGALKSVPDNVMTTDEKTEFIKQHFNTLLPFCRDVSYSESESIKPLEKQDKKNKITFGEYERAVKRADGIDYSDFIVLTIGLLRSDPAKEAQAKSLLEEVEKHYLELNYDKAIEKLKIACETLQKNNQMSSKEYTLITTTVAKPIDQNKNDTRRYFETRLGRYILGQAKKKEELSSINRISMATINTPTLGNEDIATIIPLIAHETHETEANLGALQKGTMYEKKDKARRVTVIRLTKGDNVEVSFKSGTQAADVVSKMKIDPPPTEETVRKAKNNLKIELTRENYEKVQKQEDIKKMLSPDDLLPPYAQLDRKPASPVSSSNIGSLRSISPSFRDEITQRPLINRIVDLFRPQGGAGTYSETRPSAPFVSSISGTTFTAIVHIEHYMKANANSATLNKDINDFFKQFIGTYAIQGYHSYHEIQDVLRDPKIVKLFSEYKVKLEVTIDPTTLEMALNDTLAYAKSLSLRASAHMELREVIKKRESTSGNKSESVSVPKVPALPPTLSRITSPFNHTNVAKKTGFSPSSTTAFKSASPSSSKKPVVALKNGNVTLSFKDLTDKEDFITRVRALNNASFSSITDTKTTKENKMIELSRTQYETLQKQAQFKGTLPSYDDLNTASKLTPKS